MIYLVWDWDVQDVVSVVSPSLTPPQLSSYCSGGICLGTPACVSAVPCSQYWECQLARSVLHCRVQLDTVTVTITVTSVTLTLHIIGQRNPVFQCHQCGFQAWLWVPVQIAQFLHGSYQSFSNKPKLSIEEGELLSWDFNFI